MSNQNALSHIPESSLQLLAEDLKMDLPELNTKLEEALADPSTIDQVFFEQEVGKAEGNCRRESLEFGIRHIFTIDISLLVCLGPRWKVVGTYKVIVFGKEVAAGKIEFDYRNPRVCIFPNLADVFRASLCFGLRPRNGVPTAYVEGEICVNFPIIGWKCYKFFHWLG